MYIYIYILRSTGKTSSFFLPLPNQQLTLKTDIVVTCLVHTTSVKHHKHCSGKILIQPERLKLVQMSEIGEMFFKQLFNGVCFE